VSTTPDELRTEVVAKRAVSAPALLGGSSMLAAGITGLSLPDRALVSCGCALCVPRW
jgi:hypothetical protein